MEKHEYWIDDDNYLACGTGDDYETVTNVIAQQHIEPLTAIIESQPELLEALQGICEWTDSRDGSALQDEKNLLAIKEIAEQAIAKAKQKN